MRWEQVAKVELPALPAHVGAGRCGYRGRQGCRRKVRKWS